MIIDAHVHYWEQDRPDRPWDKDGVHIGSALSAQQLLVDAAAAGVDKVVQVTPTIMGYDNRYGFEMAQRYPDRILGVFARFDPTGPEMAGRFAELRRRPAFLGVRLMLMKPPWDTWLGEGILEEFLDEAGRTATPLAVYAPHQAHLLLAAAKRHPGTRFLVDHMAIQHLDADPFTTWRDTLALASAPNIWMKADYFPEAAHEPYPFPSVQHYVHELYETFGADRLIWGSNYPPSAEAATYRQSVDLFRSELSFIDEADRAKIMGSSLLKVLGTGVTP